MSERAAPPATLLLGRPEFAGDLAHSTAWMRGKRVLVTGAAGSVGWPLAHALKAAEPERLALLDHHEYSLFSLERSLGRADERLSYELLDLRQYERVRRLVEAFKPDVLIHLAAAKHVPYGERFPEGVVENNLAATETLLKAADAAGTSVVVYPSSDKSVDPPSLYGATKRLCEALVQRWAQDGRRWCLVRYVNIIGTRGSVIETFSSQARERRPLSVTDERMTRYWISMHEALWVLLEAARAGAPGSISLPDCGEAVPLMATAERLARWYAPEQAPYPIAVTGIRPGERLHEVLLSRNEWSAPGPSAGLCDVRTRREPTTLGSVPSVVAELRQLAQAGDGHGIRERAVQAAEALQ